MTNPVLVATHGSADADTVLERAATLAAALGAALHAVCVVQPIEVHAPIGPAGAEKIADTRREHEQQAAAALRRAHTIGAKYGLDVVEHVRHGEPANAIADVADEVGAALIVLGSRGLDAAGRYVLGSVPERVLFDPHGHDVYVVRTT